MTANARYFGENVRVLRKERSYLAFVLLELLTPVDQRGENPVHLKRRPIFHLLRFQRPPPLSELFERLRWGIKEELLKRNPRTEKHVSVVPTMSATWRQK